MYVHTFYLSIYLLMGTWLAYVPWLLWIMLLLNVGVQTSFQVPAFSFVEYTPRREILGSCDNSISNFLKNCCTVSREVTEFYIPINSE